MALSSHVSLNLCAKKREMLVGGAQSFCIIFVYCVPNAKKEGGGVSDAQILSFNVRLAGWVNQA